MSTKCVKDVDPTTLATPLASLLKNVAASPYTVAPERKGELKTIIDNLGLRIGLDATTDAFAFSVTPSEKRITMGLPALERLWAYAYAYTHIFRLYQKVGGGQVMDLTAQPETEKTRKLLAWAHTNEIQGKHTPWPTDLPRPDQAAQADENLTAANEMFLLMTSFILLHETGHAVLQHTANSAMSSADFIKLELEADRWATKWAMEKWQEFKNDEMVFIKRSLGITFALSALAGIELYFPKPLMKTHPNAAGRVLAFLDEFVPETSTTKAEPRELAWLAAATILEVHLLKSGKKVDATKAYTSFREYLVEAEHLMES